MKLLLVVISTALMTVFSTEAQTVSNAGDPDTTEMFLQYMPFADQMLNKYGELRPFGVAMKVDGEIIKVGVDDTKVALDNKERYDLLFTEMKRGASSGQYRATAIFYDVQLTVPGEPSRTHAIAANLDNKNGFSSVYFYPYAIIGGRAQLRGPIGKVGDGKMFEHK